jgi:hypothetical protein
LVFFYLKSCGDPFSNYFTHNMYCYAIAILNLVIRNATVNIIVIAVKCTIVDDNLNVK